MSTVAAFAASSTAAGTQDGLTSSVTIDKTGYNKGETANISLSVKNTNNYSVSGVQLSLALPPGLALKTGQTQVAVGTLAAGETKAFALTALATSGAAAPGQGPGAGPQGHFRCSSASRSLWRLPCRPTPRTRLPLSVPSTSASW